MPTLANMKRLWVHEILRVFGDRLIDEDDTSWLIQQLHNTVGQHMDADFDSLFKDLALSPNNPAVQSIIETVTFQPTQLDKIELRM